MVKAIGVGFALLLFYVALHTLPVQWVLTILFLSTCVTLALLDPPEYDTRYWIPEEDEDPVWGVHQWTLDDERALAADRDYDEERSE